MLAHYASVVHGLFTVRFVSYQIRLNFAVELGSSGCVFNFCMPDPGVHEVPFFIWDESMGIADFLDGFAFSIALMSCLL